MGGWWVAGGYLPEGSQHIGPGWRFLFHVPFCFPILLGFGLNKCPQEKISVASVCLGPEGTTAVAKNPWLKNPVVGTLGTFNTPKYPDHVICIIYMGK